MTATALFAHRPRTSGRVRQPEPRLDDVAARAIGRQLARVGRSRGRDRAGSPSMYILELYPNAPIRDEMARSGWSQAADDDAAEMYSRRWPVSSPRVRASTRFPMSAVPGWKAATTSSTGRAATGSASGAAPIRPLAIGVGRTCPAPLTTSIESNGVCRSGPTSE